MEKPTLSSKGQCVVLSFESVDKIHWWTIHMKPHRKYFH